MHTAHPDRLVALARRAFAAVALTALLTGAVASALPVGAEECDLACQGATTGAVVTGVADPYTTDPAAAESEVVLVAGIADPYTTEPAAAESEAVLVAYIDLDQDGLTDVVEINNYGTYPDAWDSDGDGRGDGDEVNRDHTDPMTPDQPASLDSDGDGFSDYEETNVHGTNPQDRTSFPGSAGNGSDGGDGGGGGGPPTTLEPGEGGCSFKLPDECYLSSEPDDE